MVDLPFSPSTVPSLNLMQLETQKWAVGRGGWREGEGDGGRERETRESTQTQEKRLIPAQRQNRNSYPQTEREHKSPGFPFLPSLLFSPSSHTPALRQPQREPRLPERGACYRTSSVLPDAKMPRFAQVCSKETGSWQGSQARGQNRSQISAPKVRGWGVCGMKNEAAGQWRREHPGERWWEKVWSRSSCAGVTKPLPSARPEGGVFGPLTSKGHGADTRACPVGGPVVLSSLNLLS